MKPPAVPPDPRLAMQAAEAESAAALREGAEMIAAGFLKVGVAFLRAGEAERISGTLRKAGADVAPREGLTRVGVEQALQAAIEARYPRNPRETEQPWGETFRLTLAPRDCVART